MKTVDTQRTQEEIESLKRNWINDPCYDLEDVDGFESVKDELYLWRVEYEQAQNKLEIDRIRKRAGEWGVSLGMVDYIEKLESRLKTTEKKLQAIWEGSSNWGYL